MSVINLITELCPWPLLRGVESWNAVETQQPKQDDIAPTGAAIVGTIIREQQGNVVASS